jgi:hypothetical protein
MPSRAMDEPHLNVAPNAGSPREQNKLYAYRRDQTARAAVSHKDEMPTGP